MTEPIERWLELRSGAVEELYPPASDIGMAVTEAGLFGSGIRAKLGTIRENISRGIRSPGRVMAVLGGTAKVVGSVVKIDPRVERVVEALETGRDAVEAFSR